MPAKAAQLQNKKIPKLRFPGFSGEWEEKKLGDISDRITKGTTPTTLGFNYTKSGINFIKIESITEDGNFLIDKFAHIDENCNQALKRSQLKEGDILFSIAGALGRVVMANKDVLPANTNQALAIISPKSGVSSKYIREVLRSDFIQNQINRLKVGLAQSNISLAQVSNFSIHTPSLPEQKKLIGFVGAVDEWIENLKKQKESFESYKKGIVQKIFSQEIRFKNEKGKDFPKWEGKKLADCLDYEQPTNYIVKSTEYDSSYKTPVLTAGKTFILGFTDETSGIFLTTDLPVIIFDDFTTTSQFVDFPFKVKSSAMKILKAKDGTDIKFIYEAMTQIKYEIGGHGRHWISKYSNIKLPVPTLPEQQKIADFLTSVDNVIESKQQQITQAEQWKKGLMQGLFV